MPNNKPSAPNTKRLEEFIDQFDSDIENDVTGDISITAPEATFVRDTLIWTLNMLNGRKVYQKKQQIKKKVINRLYKEYVSAQERANIEAAAAKEAAATVLPAKEVDGDED
jgi:hypothetical protein